jgi:hypothetical protein
MQVMRIPEAVSTVEYELQTRGKDRIVFMTKAMKENLGEGTPSYDSCISLNTTILGIIFQVGFHRYNAFIYLMKHSALHLPIHMKPSNAETFPFGV